MRKKLLSLLVLLMVAVTGAWAQRLYLEVNGTAATLKYSANEADYSGKPSFTGTMWQNASGFKASVETITVDASCENFAGDKLQGLFAACTKLTSITGLGTINTTNVTTMQTMFNNCSSLASLDLSGFNTANVTTMQNMFSGCSSLETVDLSGFNTANVTTMQNMFASCLSLETVDLSSFNTASVTTMKSMFYECSKLTAIFVGDDWSTASSTDYMFYNCTSLPNWDGTDDGTKAYYGGDGKGYLTYKTLTPEPEPATHTLQLVVNDPAMGSVAVTNLLGSGIVDNQDGTYTVPENAEVHLLATANEGYKFTGWSEANLNELVGCYYCGVALNTLENTLTFTMTEDKDVLAKFAALTYSVALKEGTEDAAKWTVEPTEAAAGTQVSLTYSGLKKVKSVKAVKKAAAAPSLLSVTVTDPDDFGVGAKTIYYYSGETWGQAIANHPTENDGWYENNGSPAIEGYVPWDLSISASVKLGDLIKDDGDYIF